MTRIKEYFKKEWWKIYLCDLAWISFITLFLIYSRYKISSYLSLINSYAGDFNIIKDEISNNTIKGAQNLQVLLSQVSPLVDRLNLFVFFIVPAVVFLIWVIFNSIEYAVLRKEKIRHLLPALIIVTLPFYLLLLYLLNQILNLIRENMFGNWKLYLIVLIMIIICYVLHLSYSFVTTKDIKGSSLKWILSVIPSVKSSLPLFVLYPLFLTLTTTLGVAGNIFMILYSLLFLLTIIWGIVRGVTWDIFMLYSISILLLFGSVLNIAIKYVTNNIGSTAWSFVSALLAILAMGLTKYLLHNSLRK